LGYQQFYVHWRVCFTPGLLRVPGLIGLILFHYNTCMLMTILYLVLGILGAGLVNYLSDMLPRFRKVGAPICPHCGEKIGWKFYWRFSSCDQCGTGPTLRHWLVLISLPILAVLMHYFPPPVLGNGWQVLWLVYFGLVVVIDLEHRLILHPVSLVGAVLGFLAGMEAHGILDTVIGGVGGFGIMLFFYLMGELFIRFLSKRRGEEIQEVALGFGDVNLAGVIGTILGWPGIVGGIFVAVLLGGFISGIFLMIQLIRKEYQAYQALPYGPFLVISVFLLLYISSLVG
jgi:leader peptidase (prepilin peptidase)/N-methyltransferase